MQSCNVAGLFEVNNYICTYLIRWHELSNSKKLCLSTGENCGHVAEKATGLQRQPGAPERFQGDLSLDWLHGSCQRSWHQSPLHWWRWHQVKPWILMSWGIQQQQTVNKHDFQVVVWSHHFLLSQNPVSWIAYFIVTTKHCHFQRCGAFASVKTTRSWDRQEDPPAVRLHLWSEHRCHSELLQI